MLAQLLVDDAQVLIDAWTAGDAPFEDSLATAGAGSPDFPTAQDALNALSDALFYVETEVKDMKMAEPLGSACDEEGCPESLESQYAQRSRENVIDNLYGFKAVFQGSADDPDALGFDDVLADVGAEELATDMLEAVDAAIAALEGQEATWASDLDAGGDAMANSYGYVAALTTLLKTSFVATLDLALPKSAEGDND